MKNLKVFSLNEFINLNIPAKEYLLNHNAKTRNSNGLFSDSRKNLVCIGATFAVSTGTKFLNKHKSH